MTKMPNCSTSCPTRTTGRTRAEEEEEETSSSSLSAAASGNQRGQQQQQEQQQSSSTWTPRAPTTVARWMLDSSTSSSTTTATTAGSHHHHHDPNTTAAGRFLFDHEHKNQKIVQRVQHQPNKKKKNANTTDSFDTNDTTTGTTTSSSSTSAASRRSCHHGDIIELVDDVVEVGEAQHWEQQQSYYHHQHERCVGADHNTKDKDKNDDDDDAGFQKDHLGDSRQYWRDIILGVNDGLVSTFLLVAGVTGANLSNEDILLTAIAGTIAGAISMSSGEYIATKTQEEVFAGEVGLERAHIARHREEELLELRECFEKIGIVSQNEAEQDEVDDLHQRLYAFYRPRDHAHLLAHVVLEFGILEDERRNPVVAATVAFCLFVCGALPSVIPYTFIANVNVAFGTAGIFTLTGLFLVGAIKTWATRGNMWHAAIENLAVSAGGGAVAFAVGYAFERLVRGGGNDDDLADGGGVDQQLYPPM